VIRALLNRGNLPAQMIAGFVVVVLLATLTIGLPAILLIRQQMDRQAWMLVEQGQRAAEAFCAAEQRDIISFATLIAERPTLNELLRQDDPRDLKDFLGSLQTAGGYDLILVCDASDRVVASTDESVPGQICSDDHSGGIYTTRAGEAPQVLMTAVHPVFQEEAIIGRVIIGTRMDHSYTTQMRAYSGLETTLLVDGEVAASSFDVELPVLSALDSQPVEPGTPGGITRSRFTLGDQPYYAGKLPLQCLGVTIEVALPVGENVGAQNRLVGLLVGEILVVAALGSILVIYIARRISQPLVNLAEQASGFSQGDLSTPIAVETEVREVALLAQALEDGRGNLLRTLTDLRREEAWSNHLLESIAEGIMTLDAHMRITFFSHGAERITGWSREEVLNRSCDDFFKPEEIDAPFSKAIPLPGLRRKFMVRLANERVASLSVSGARLSRAEAGEDLTAVVFRDVTETDLVHHLLGHFIANVVHEFRTPLAALNASIELLLDQYEPGERQDLVKGLQVSVTNLQTLVDNLLESASFEAGHFRVSPRPYDLSDLVSEAVRIMRPLLEKYGQQLLVKMPAALPLVKADPRRTVQVLVNLLSNASKYGPADIEIVLSVSIEEDFVRVRVVDRGPGIPPEQQENLFRRFVNPEARQANIKVGAGLGLSVVKAIVEAHGGGVGVENLRWGGTAFWFTIPIAMEI